MENLEPFSHTKRNDCFIVGIYIDRGIILKIFYIALNRQGVIDTIIEQNIKQPAGIIAI